MNKYYYDTMLAKNRLMPFFRNNKMVCFLTFYIGTIADKDKFVRTDPWSIVDDNSDGDICWIDQLITSKKSENPKLSYEIWRRFKNFIKENYRNVKHIRWNHWKNGKVAVFIKKL